MVVRLSEVRKEDNLYFIGPFWIIGASLSDINEGNLEILSHKFLVDYDGNYVSRVKKSEFTHKGIWESNYKSKYNVEFDYYPRGRVSFDRLKKEFCVNIPTGLNEEIVVEKLIEDYDLKDFIVNVKYTDPTSGNHYTFKLK